MVQSWQRWLASIGGIRASKTACGRALDVLLFSAGTGRLQHIAAGAEVVWLADVNRDGIGDVCSYVPPKEAVRRHGEVSLYQGLAAEYWRRIGDARFPICDLDGDGVRDLLRQAGHSEIEASSGRIR